jgi:hypothetical protein
MINTLLANDMVKKDTEVTSTWMWVSDNNNEKTPKWKCLVQKGNKDSQNNTNYFIGTSTTPETRAWNGRRWELVKKSVLENNN